MAGEELSPPRPLPWYPQKLAWQMDASRAQLRKLDALAAVHEFMKRENDVRACTERCASALAPESSVPESSAQWCKLSLEACTCQAVLHGTLMAAADLNGFGIALCPAGGWHHTAGGSVHGAAALSGRAAPAQGKYLIQTCNTQQKLSVINLAKHMKALGRDDEF